jgi:uncharacterized tellurite resistance protein B-like protein
MDSTELSLASLEMPKLEAFLEMMFLAAFADGDIGEAERADFGRQVMAATKGQLAPDLVDGILKSLQKSLERDGRSKRLATIKARIPDEKTRRAALSLAAQVVLADGQVHVDEVAFLYRAAEALDIDPKEAMAHLP